MQISQTTFVVLSGARFACSFCATMEQEERGEKAGPLELKVN